VVYTLPKLTVYTIVKQSGDWVLMNAGGRKQGWVRGKGYCLAQCEPLLDTARFTASLLEYMAGTERGLSLGQLAPDADVLRVQIANYREIDNLKLGFGPSPETFLKPVAQKLKDFGERGVVPAGGAALANALAIDRVVELLYRQTFTQAVQSHEPQDRVYARLEPDRAAIGAIAFDLAEASLLDPKNPDVLQNLAVLFDYAGDEKRASLARILFEKVHND
jgi:hypothetical protein